MSHTLIRLWTVGGVGLAGKLWGAGGDGWR